MGARGGRRLAFLCFAGGILVCLDLFQGTLFGVGTCGASRPFARSLFSDDGSRLLAPVSGKESAEPWASLLDLRGCRPVRARFPGQWEDPSRLPILSASGDEALFLRNGAVWTMDLRSGASRKTFSPDQGWIYHLSASADLKRVLFEALDRKQGHWRGVHVVDLE